MGAICTHNCSVDQDTHQLLLSHEISKRKWINDDLHSKCMVISCSNAFTIINRKHHCRFCGHVICSKCSKRKIMSKRICDECYANYIKINTEPNNKLPEFDTTETKIDNSYQYPSMNWSLSKMKDEMNDFSDMLHSQIKQQYQQCVDNGSYEFNKNDNELKDIFKHNDNDNVLGRYNIFKAWDFWQLQLKFSPCCCLDDCDSLKRLLFVLNIYHKWNDSKKYQSSMNILDIINSLQTYSMKNIFNDYMHIKECHGAKQLNNFLQNDMKKNWWFDMDGISYNIEYFCTRKCNNDKAMNCCFVRKIFSDHDKCNDECLCYVINTKFMSSYGGSQYRNDLIKRNTYLGCNKGDVFECIQLLDMIHCFLFHNLYSGNWE
eukprot:380890_1